MKAAVLGRSGHIGTYLVPQLVRAGYHVVNVSRAARTPYAPDPLWREVESVVLDRETEPAFERKVAALKNTNLSHYVYCSSIWAHGKATFLPIREDVPRFPLDEYGTQKALSEAYLHRCHRLEGFPETVVMPGQISGPGWSIINPAGNTDPLVFQKIGRGEAIQLPNFGMETLYHVHADDVAQVLFKALKHRTLALGESFHATGAEAVTLVGLAEALYRLFGKEPRVELLPWKEWCKATGDQHDRSQGHHRLRIPVRLLQRPSVSISRNRVTSASHRSRTKATWAGWPL
jgi:nucleoside-diphosphate-sugar epimerase